MKRHSFLPLYAANFFGVLNDNFLKTLAGFVAISWLRDEKAAATLMGATGAALVAPYILCSPLADRLTCVFEKKTIFRLAKWAELPVIAIAVAGFASHSIATVVAAILLMGLQSSLYSPAKYALVRDIGGEERVSVGMGGMEGVSFLAVLAGTVAASALADGAPPWVHWCCLGALALLGLVSSYAIRAEEEKGRSLHSVNPLRYMARAARMAKRYEGLNAVILALSVFWFAAAMLQQGLIVYGRQTLGLDSARTGSMLCVAALGIVAGQVIAGFVDRKHNLICATVATGWIAAAAFFGIFFIRPGYCVLSAMLALLAFDLGFFKLPLDAEIQKTVKGPRLNTMLAYFNQVSFLFMFAASAVYVVIGRLFGPAAFFAFLGGIMFLAPVVFVFHNRKALVLAGRWLFRRRYDVAADGLECLDDKGKAYLVLPNHPAMIDPMLVVSELWRTPLKPLADEAFFRTGVVAPRVLKTLGAVEVPDLRKHRTARGATIARGLADIVKGALANGGNVIFYPSGHIWTEPKEEIGTRQLAYNICRELPRNVEVIGVRTSGLWGSIWSRKGRSASPRFIPTLLKSAALWLFWAPFVRRRKVCMKLENLTARAKDWAKGTRLEFNARLEEWYNGG